MLLPANEWHRNNRVRRVAEQRTRFQNIRKNDIKILNGNSETLKGTKLMQKKLSAQWTARIWFENLSVELGFALAMASLEIQALNVGNTAEILHFCCLVFVWHCEKWNILNAWCTFFFFWFVGAQKQKMKRKTNEKDKNSRRKIWNILGLVLT